MFGFIKKRPEPQPTEYRREFDEKEVIRALTFYMEKHGVDIPKGSIDLYGMRRPRSFDDTPKLVLTIMSKE